MGEPAPLTDTVPTLPNLLKFSPGAKHDDTSGFPALVSTQYVVSSTLNSMNTQDYPQLLVWMISPKVLHTSGKISVTPSLAILRGARNLLSAERWASTFPHGSSWNNLIKLTACDDLDLRCGVCSRWSHRALPSMVCQSHSS